MRTKNTPSEKKIVDAVTKRILGQIQPALAKKQSKVPQTFMVPIGFNTMMADANRRQTYGTTTTYQTLRQLSQQHETTRAAINLRKRQITQLDWGIVSVDPDTNIDDNKAKKIKMQVSQIGGPGIRFRNLLDKFIEDTLVLDAFCFYKQRTVGNKLLRIIPIDPSTIKLRVDEAGMRPLPPEFAFEQWIRGQKVTDMTTDDLTYEEMNPRTNSPYGISPIEAMIVTLDASMRAMLYNLAYLSDNNIPNGFLNMPEEWTPDQIKEYKEWLDSVVSGPKEQAKVFPIPSGANYQATTKPKDFHFEQFFDYLDRRVCMVFDLAPQELGLTGQQYKENADSQEVISMRKGLKPLANFIEDIFTDIIQTELGYDDLKFKFSGLETKFKYDDAQKLIPLGVIGIDEMRNDMGLKKLGVPNLIIQGGSVTPVDQIGKEPTTVSGSQSSQSSPDLKTNVQNPKPETPPDKDIKADLQAWMNKAINDYKKKGKVYRKFESTVIPAETQTYINKALNTVKSIDDIKSVFKGKKNPVKELLKSPKAKQMKAKIKAKLREQMNPFMQHETIADFTGAEKYDTGFANKFDEWFKSFNFDGLDEYMKWAGEQGFINGTKYDPGVADVKASFKQVNPKFDKWLGNRKNFIIDSVDETTKDWISRMIQEGKRNQLSNAEIADQISEQYEDISDNRAEMIVNTELANALIEGELESYKEQGIEKKMWITSDDELVDGGDEDGVCASVHEEVVDVEDEFSNGYDGPPAHPNCRCYVNPVLNNEE